MQEDEEMEIYSLRNKTAEDIVNFLTENYYDETMLLTDLGNNFEPLTDSDHFLCVRNSVDPLKGGIFLAAENHLLKILKINVQPQKVSVTDLALNQERLIDRKDYEDGRYFVLIATVKSLLYN